MKITNKQNLPEVLVKAIENREYSKGEAKYSATGLLQPPQIQALISRHPSGIEVDVSESIWALFGSAVHNILELAGKDEEQQIIVEQRLYAELAGIIISGMFDRYDNSLYSIDDWKVTSVFKVQRKEFEDWEAQLNIYAWLFKINYPNLPLEKLRIVAILRDWSHKEAREALIKDTGYPLAQVQVIELPIWSQLTTVKFLVNKLELHETARKISDDKVLAEKFPCSPEDRWAKSDGYILYNSEKNYTYRAYYANNEQTIEECKEKAYIAQAKMKAPGYEVKFKKGESLRCEYFCNAKKFCQQYKATNENEVIASEQKPVSQIMEELS